MNQNEQQPERTAKKLTKKQMRQFARIQSGLIIYNSCGGEFTDSDISIDEEYQLREYMHMHADRLLKNTNEYRLNGTAEILEYVRKNF